MEFLPAYFTESLLLDLPVGLLLLNDSTPKWAVTTFTKCDVTTRSHDHIRLRQENCSNWSAPSKCGIWCHQILGNLGFCHFYKFGNWKFPKVQSAADKQIEAEHALLHGAQTTQLSA